ncbi:MAG: BrnT family toxin [Rhodoferax sp.]|nr:BrnT family toxin [Rhodoferax sp.]
MYETDANPHRDRPARDGEVLFIHRPGVGKPLDANTFCIYIWRMEFKWSEAKRATNIKSHGLDFVDAASVFDGMTYTFEDDRFSYGGQRFVTLDLLSGIPVSVVLTENEHEIRIIWFGKATKRESQINFDAIQN